MKVFIGISILFFLSGCATNYTTNDIQISSTSIVVTQQMIDEMKNRRGK